MKTIELTQGKVCLVDDEDFAELKSHKWHAINKGTKASEHWYAGATMNGRSILMHRYLLRLTDRSLVGDHKDGNGLNNQRANLRIATPKQNTFNRSKVKKDGAYWGISRQSVSAGWVAKVGGEYLGTFALPIMAAAAYDAGAKRLHGEFATLNNIQAANDDAF